MPATEWKTLGRVDPARDYLALLTYLPLHHRWHVLTMMHHTRRVVAQLQRTPGLVGYALLVRPMSAEFWTLSAWEDVAALRAFVGDDAHAAAIHALMPHMGATRFIRWKVRGAGLPPRWEDALDRWSIHAP